MMSHANHLKLMSLEKAQIDVSLPRIVKGLRQYLDLQATVRNSTDFHRNATFRRRYNHFYRVRRGAQWQDAFYGLMNRAKIEQLQFPAVLNELRKTTNRYEASFASKLVATLDPSKPIIDSIVLKNLGLRLPATTSANRAVAICDIYESLVSRYDAFLKTESGVYLVEAFKDRYQNEKISEVKMLDLVLWQTR